jgi:single-strand DNA-binding protein
MNKVILIGNLGRDPEMSYLQDGTAVTKFSIAVSRPARSSGGERERETDWYNVTAWRQHAERCSQFLHKGSKVYVEGHLAQRKYVDRNNIERVSIDVTLTDMELLTPKNQQPDGAPANAGGGDFDDLGDLGDHPF